MLHVLTLLLGLQLSAADAKSATLCVELPGPAVASLSESDIVAALRARVPAGSIRVVACSSQPKQVTWTVTVERLDETTIRVAARGGGLDEEQLLSVAASGARSMAREAALAAAELVRPTLIAWLETEGAVEVPVGEPPVATEPLVEAPASEPPAPQPRLSLGARAGPALRASSAPGAQLGLRQGVRYRGWVAALEVAGTLWPESSARAIRTRFSELELSVGGGRDLFDARWVIVAGVQGRRTWTKARGDSDVVPQVGAWSAGVHLATSVSVWRSARWELGAMARLAWWRGPIELLYRGVQLRSQARLDVSLAPYFTIFFD